MKNEDQMHWADEKEVVKSNKPLKLILGLLKHLPGWVVRLVAYPISFFYFLFSSRARNESYRFQNQLREYTKGEYPKRISAFKQILSFAFSIIEKMQGWLGQIDFNQVGFCDDAVEQLREQLRQKKGSVIIFSHLGNMELIRSISYHIEDSVGREVPIFAVMDLSTSEQFTKTINEINERATVNVIDSSNIGPDTICFLMEEMEKGSLLFIAGDRTSAYSRDKVIVNDFLGKPAQFPYGSFLIPFLLKSSVYYMFGLRSKTAIFNPKYKLYFEKSQIDTECGRTQREDNINAMCQEFIGNLENYTKQYPYQWYNFHNFWNI